MKTDMLKAAATYIIATLVLLGSFYGLVLYPFVLDDLVKGALIGAMTAAYTFVFGSEIAKQTSAASQKAYDKGLATPTPQTSVTTADTVNVNPPPDTGGTP